MTFSYVNVNQKISEKLWSFIAFLQNEAQRVRNGDYLARFAINTFLIFLQISTPVISIYWYLKGEFLISKTLSVIISLTSILTIRYRQMNIVRIGWMDDLRFYILFNSISVISRRWADDNERLCAMKTLLRLKRSPPQAGLDPGG